jgi:hypothetical protein
VERGPLADRYTRLLVYGAEISVRETPEKVVRLLGSNYFNWWPLKNEVWWWQDQDPGED